jgi:hypothetical protein
VAEKVYNAVLPPCPRSSDRQQLQFNSAVKQALDELKKQLVISQRGTVARAGSDAASDDYGIAADLGLNYGTPSAPTNLQATGAIENIVLEWDYQGAPVEYFEIWRADSDNFGLAELRAVSEVPLFADVVGPGVAFYYWVRGVSSGGVFGPYNDTAGVLGETSANPLDEIVKASESLDIATLSAELGEAGFGVVEINNQKTFAVLADRFAVVDGDNDRLSPFFVSNGVAYINTAMIGNAAISSAQIASLAADKISATTLSAITANAGTITAGVLKSSDNKFVIDLTNKTISITV